LPTTKDKKGIGKYIAQFHRATNYDQFGRVRDQYDATGLGIRAAYNAFGYLLSETELATGQLLREVKEIDALGNVTAESYVNGHKLTRTYDLRTGFLSHQTVGDLSGPVLDLGDHR